MPAGHENILDYLSSRPKVSFLIYLLEFVRAGFSHISMPPSANWSANFDIRSSLLCIIFYLTFQSVKFWLFEHYEKTFALASEDGGMQIQIKSTLASN